MVRDLASNGDAPARRLPSVAVLIPCYNEAVAIGEVVLAFRDSLPTAAIYVYDNNSRDGTAAAAAAAGAIVRSETRQGKGFVVRRMFADIEADVYVIVDGDGTYDAGRAGELVARLVDERLDMVTAVRSGTGEAYRPGHRWGNRLLTRCVALLFGRGFSDMLSGYRVFSRRFVKSFPVTATGFEIETELTVHALELELPCAEIVTAFQDRPAGSESKLRTFADGFRILWTIFKLLKRERPMLLFGSVAAGLMVLVAILLWPVFETYFATGKVPRFPTLIAGVGLALVGLLSLTCGLVLDTVSWGRREMKRLAYLALPPLREPR